MDTRAPQEHFPSLVHLLRQRAREFPDKRLYTYLEDGEQESAALTYGELESAARAIAASLLEAGAEGERVILLYPPGLDFITAFFGCLYAGGLAVPVYPPQSARTLPRLLSVVRDARPTVALVSAQNLERSQIFLGKTKEFRSVRWLAAGERGGEEVKGGHLPKIDGNSLAFLQYTSGSTSTPKGVMVSHGNLLHNQALIQRVFGQSDDSVIVGWLPLYHDMGLIGNVLQPLYSGASCVLMSPLAFLQRPARWLEAISRYRGTTSGGPNFSYELCVAKVKEEARSGLDLRSWRVAFNGAEPVRANTLERFAEAFAPAGFKKSAFLPCYGLAESTLLVAGESVEAEPTALPFDSEALEQHRVERAPEGRTLVSCGAVPEGLQVKIVHPGTRTTCSAETVGEIWVAGESVAHGYWQRPVETKEGFQACLADSGDGPFLRTGDLGFLDQGQLFITGRLKDLIIIRGRNHYPQDIELTTERCHPALRPGSGSAFSLEVAEEEHLVVVQEVSRSKAEGLDYVAVTEAIRLEVAEHHGVGPQAVVLLRQGGVPKTSSGKVQRRLCRRLLLEGSLPILYRDDLAVGEITLEPEVESGQDRDRSIESSLRQAVARSLRVAPASVDPLRPLAFDSLEAIELKNRLLQELGIDFSLRQLLEQPTLADLVEGAADPVKKTPGAGLRLVASGEAGEVPLSYGQQALWLLQHLSPGNGAYNICFAARVQGSVDRALLRRCFQRLAERHESLRTSFENRRDGVVQRPAETTVLAFQSIPAEAWSAGQLSRRLAEEAARPFDLESELPTRVFLYPLAAEGAVLQLVVHHIAVDMWSLVVLAEELGELYSQLPQGETEVAPRRPDSPTYWDFVRWQRALVESEEGARQLAYWQEVLAGDLPVLEVPTDRPRPPVQSFRGGAVPFRLNAAMSEGLEGLARKSGVTPFVPLAALYQLLLQRYSNGREILVGTPAAGRSQPGMEGLVGYFVNPVVLRVTLPPEEPFDDFLARLKSIVIGALEHQDYPFPRLVEHLEFRRDPSRSPVFQAFFALERPQRDAAEGFSAFALGLPGATMKVGPLELESVAVEQRTAQFDLALMAGEVDGCLAGSLQYNADLFDAVTARRLAEHYERLLAAFVESPHLSLAEPSLLTTAESEALRSEWNRATPFPGERCLHELVRAQATRTPDRVAVGYNDETLTYRQLEMRTDRLAQTLRRLGVGPEVRVGVAVERSLLLPVATLGVLKAGGAYVPLDPSYPPQRLAFMLEDSGASVLVTEERAWAVLPETAVETVFLDRQDSQGEGEEEGPLGEAAIPENLAYLLYTSGSTGKPKGVMVSHRSLVNFLTSMAARPGIAEESVLLAVTPLSFDISGLELYLPLLVGGRVEVASRQECAEARRLDERLTTCGATHMQATPATWRMLLDAGWKGKADLRILCGGEALDGALAERLLPRGESVWNLYGPTETTIWSAVDPVTKARAGTAPLGRAIANTGLLVLDARLEPVPPGVPGQLWIGGAGVARGYAGRPALTAARFLPDPFAEISGARMYDTGDLACHRADGILKFLGRVDHQVKVRGFRIELGEIESRLAELPAVRQAVVVAHRRGGGDDRLVAYLVPEEERPAVADLKAAVADRLPEYMVPSLWMFLDALPLTPNGKVDRRALPTPEGERSAVDSAYVAPQGELEGAIAAIWRDVLGVDRVGIDDNFFDLGGHSLLMGPLQLRLQEMLDRLVSLVDLFRYPTIRSLAAGLAGKAGRSPSEEGAGRAEKRRQAFFGKGPREEHRGDVAIIGLAGRFPGAAHVDDLWRLLREGREGIRALSDDEVLAAGCDPARLEEPGFVKAEGVLEGAELFDAGYFSYTPKEAAAIDPQHRVFLEGAVEALGDAGYQPDDFAGTIGVFAGTGLNSYLLHQVGDAVRGLDPAEAYQLMIGNDKDFLPTRVSYKLNLTGPSVSVQTACSTSLVAVHLACRSLLQGECDLALAGGVSIATPQGAGYLYQPGMILSPDGHCRAFDAEAGGTVRGNGMGIVVLKRLDEALADGDTVRAVVRGSAINNDGAHKVGYTAPSVERQAAVIAEALAVAAVEPDTLSYIEAHGTGTEMGDPIEIEALTDAFRRRTERRGFCAIGSVKSNLGHLDAAAGVTGLIKTVLALEHGELPPSLHFQRPNPRVDFEGSPFRVVDQLRPWTSNDGVRRAGVSSFGIGGTNAHLVVEEAPDAVASGPSRPWQLLTLSARSGPALEQMIEDLGRHFTERLLPAAAEAALPDAAFTLARGRWEFAHRRVLVAPDLETAARMLTEKDPAALLGAKSREPSPRVAFLFPGQGSQYPGMSRGLYETEPSFRETVDQCCEILRQPLGLDLREVLFSQDAEQLEETQLAQPALFVVEYALSRLWMEWGVRPTALLGHSIGEYTAACLAGVFPLEDGLRLVAERGRLMGERRPGAMLSISRPWEEIEPSLPEALSLAAVNAPTACVVSGPAEAVASFHGLLEEEGIESRRLHTSHAFHSSMMEPALEPFRRAFEGVPLQSPTIPFLSNVTGTWIEAEQATDPEYWVRHLRQPVRFVDAVGALLGDSRRLLLEVGPGRTLSTLARQHPEHDSTRLTLTSLRHPRDQTSDEAFLLTTLGRLWLVGVEVNWASFYRHQRRHRIPLPTYSFERQRHWLERSSTPALAPQPRIGEIGKSPPAEWLYLPSWRRTFPPPAQLPPLTDETAARPWLIIKDRHGVGDALEERLATAGRAVFTVPAGLGKDMGEDEKDFEPLVARLEGEGKWPSTVVYLAPLSASGPATADEHRDELGYFFSFLSLVRGLAQRGEGASVEVVMVGSHLMDVRGDEVVRPDLAALQGICRVAPQEAPHLSCRTIDLELPRDIAQGAAPARRLAERILGELTGQLASQSEKRSVAYRGKHRWVPSFEAIPARESETSRLRDGGRYLILGGFGDIGGSLARHLAREHRARLALVGRTALNGERSKIALIEELEANGAEVLLLAADVANEAAMVAVARQVQERFGGLDGVIYAAGFGGLEAACTLQSTHLQNFADHLQTRGRGLEVLAKVLTESGLDEQLDFRLVCSSLSSILGGIGYTAYSAANLYMDAWIQRRNRSAASGGGWTGVNWDAWRFSKDDRPGTELAMTPEEGSLTFRRVLALDPTLDPWEQVVVSTGPLEPRLRQWVDRASTGSPGESKADGATATHARPDLQNAYVAPSDPLEKAIGEIWQRQLGIDRVGIHDNFFELGGTSLLGVQVFTELNRVFKVEIPTVSLYEGSTVKALAEVVRGLQSGDFSAQEELLDESHDRGSRRRESVRRRKEALRSGGGSR